MPLDWPSTTDFYETSLWVNSDVSAMVCPCLVLALRGTMSESSDDLRAVRVNISSFAKSMVIMLFRSHEQSAAPSQAYCDFSFSRGSRMEMARV